MGRRRADADLLLLNENEGEPPEFLRDFQLFVDGRTRLKNLGSSGGAITVREDGTTFLGDRWSLSGSGEGLTSDGHTFPTQDWNNVPMSLTTKAFLVMEFGARTAAPLVTHRRLWSCKAGNGSGNPGYQIEMPNTDGQIRLNGRDASIRSTPLVDIGLNTFTEPTRVLFTLSFFQFFGVTNVFQLVVNTPTATQTSQGTTGSNAPSSVVDLTGIDGMSWGAGLNSQTTGPGGGPNIANGFDTTVFSHVHVLGFGHHAAPPLIRSTWTAAEVAALRRYYGIRG